MELNQARIEDAIVREVADKIIGEDDLYRRVTDAVDRRIDAHFKNIADRQIQEAIEAAIKDGFEREYCRINSFGQKQGAPTTIRAELEKMIGGYWNQSVDQSGKATDSSYNRMTRAEWLMTKLVADDFSGNMKQHIVNLGGALKDKLRAELHTTVNKLLSEVIHVKSAGDQALGNPGRACIDPEPGPVKP